VWVVMMERCRIRETTEGELMVGVMLCWVSCGASWAGGMACVHQAGPGAGGAGNSIASQWIHPGADESCGHDGAASGPIRRARPRADKLCKGGAPAAQGQPIRPEKCGGKVLDNVLRLAFSFPAPRCCRVPNHHTLTTRAMTAPFPFRSDTARDCTQCTADTQGPNPLDDLSSQHCPSGSLRVPAAPGATASRCRSKASVLQASSESARWVLRLPPIRARSPCQAYLPPYDYFVCFSCGAPCSPADTVTQAGLDAHRQLRFFDVVLIVLIVHAIRRSLPAVRAERERLQRHHDALRRFHANAACAHKRREAASSTRKLLSGVAMDLQVSDRVSLSLRGKHGNANPSCAPPPPPNAHLHNAPHIHKLHW
jgi:hypothetical protein